MLLLVFGKFLKQCSVKFMPVILRKTLIHDIKESYIITLAYSIYHSSDAAGLGRDGCLPPPRTNSALACISHKIL